MSEPRVVPRAEWAAARARLLAVEEELTRARDALNLARRTLPAVRIEQDYRLVGPAGETTLPAVFEGRRQLVVVHLMYASGRAGLCPGCAFLADGIGELAHLHARDTTLVAVSAAPYAELAAFGRRMGWTFPWYSSAGGDFDADFGVSGGGREISGVSVLLRSGADVLHTYSAHGRGLELLLGTYMWLDLTPLGRQEGWGGTPDRGRDWVRLHDEYGLAPQDCRTAAM
jgi:predicted dithiol-disulfide oxidoreductase (DUF899 family)